MNSDLIDDESLVETISATDLDLLIECGDVVLIDVRSPWEYADGRIDGALNAPLSHFDPAVLPVDETRETILYCGSGNRSGQAAKLLAEHLGTAVRHLEGGMGAWNDAGLEAVASNRKDDPRSD